MAFNGSGAIKAWVTSNTSATNLKSYGISSLSDDGTGQLGITLTTASSNTNYCVFSSYKLTGRVNPNIVTFVRDTGSQKTTTEFIIETNGATGGLSDSATEYYVLVVDTF